MHKRKVEICFSILLSVSFGNLTLYSDEPPAQNGEIIFSEQVYNFGSIKTGDRASKKFNFKNSGKGDLVISALKTTCGCTAAVASTGPYRPGETGEIDVTYNSSGKVGFAFKDVQVVSNDPKSPHNLRVQGLVIADIHPTKTTADVLFSGSCAECHAIPAKGKMGKELYDGVCYLCHDFPQEHGKPKIASSQNALATLSKGRLKKLISDGIPNTAMPGFSQRAGGPLSKEQIESLTDFLVAIRKKK